MMNNLPPEIIDNHILPLLDGTALTALSSVSSEFRRTIFKKEELWKKICASTWPFLLPNMNHVISTFPGGYRSFFSDAFPSLHCNNNNSQFNSIDLPPIDLFYFIDLSLEQGEIKPYHHSSTEGITVSTVICDVLNTKSDKYCHFQGLCNLSVLNKYGDWMNYFQDNLRLSWIVLDGTRKRAISLFGPCSKPVWIKRTSVMIGIVYENVMPGQCEAYTEMVKCYMKVTCSGQKETRLEVGMEDMNGKRVLHRHANMIILNAFLNGERKKF